MLPFLKNRQDGASAMPVDSIRRKPDEDSDDYSMLDAVAEDLLLAFERKDKRLIKEALESLVDHIREQDEIDDRNLLEEMGE